MKARPLLAAALCLLAGLASQTLLAWVLFVRSDYTGGTGVLNAPPLKAGDKTVTGFVVPADWNSQVRVEWWGAGKTRETVSEAQWLGSRLGYREGGGRQATYNGFAAGWPLRSLCGCDYMTPGVQPRVPAPLVSVPAWIKAGGFKVPVAPRWPQLIANSLLFSVPFAAAFAIVDLRRRRRRRRLGLCVRCGYNIAGLARCPECGDVAGEAR